MPRLIVEYSNDIRGCHVVGIHDEKKPIHSV